MISLTRAVEMLISNPRPMLCLDTCDFLDVVRCFAEADLREANLHNARSFREILRALLTDPDRFQVVVTYLVRHEFHQNIDEAGKKVSRHIEEIDRRVDLIAEASKLGMGALPASPARVEAQSLLTGLGDLAKGVMDRALIIEKDAECVERALIRVMDRRRPSHKGEIKDSIH